MASRADCSIGDVLEFLCPGVLAADPRLDWPPDVFAIAACLLHRSGAYVYVVQDWPPKLGPQPRGKQQVSEWKEVIKNAGEVWRTACISGKPCPQEVSH